MDDSNGKWNKIVETKTDNKWELKYNDKVLATIYKKLINNKYSLYISSPKIYKDYHEISVTHQYGSLEEAQSACHDFLTNEIGTWASAVCEYLKNQAIDMHNQMMQEESNA